MKKNAARKLVVVSVLLLCVFMAGCGCGKKKKDPATQQVLKISITPEPSPAPEPDKMDQKAVVKNGNITCILRAEPNQQGNTFRCTIRRQISL